MRRERRRDRSLFEPRSYLDAKLMVFGMGGASTDAQHVAVEFVHPVIVGKRAPGDLADH